MSEIATLGGGCYWCLEAIYKRITGIESVVSGYSGGQVEHPTIDQVYAGGTGHAEVVQVRFDPSVISYKTILEIFFTMHNPTTLNRQDYDVGEIYRSIILFHTPAQERTARQMMAGFARELWPDPIVTHLQAYKVFWPADESMQDYFERNPYAGYCQVIINPKIKKLRQKFLGMMKPEAV